MCSFEESNKEEFVSVANIIEDNVDADYSDPIMDEANYDKLVIDGQIIIAIARPFQVYKGGDFIIARISKDITKHLNTAVAAIKEYLRFSDKWCTMCQRDKQKYVRFLEFFGFQNTGKSFDGDFDVFTIGESDE